MAKTQKKPVKRAKGSDGKLLPTRKELALVDVLSDRWKVEPPSGYRSELLKTRAFIDLLVLSKEQSFADVLRRLRIARQMVYDGWPAKALAEKFFLSSMQAETLYDLAQQRAQKKWPQRELVLAIEGGAAEDAYSDEAAPRDHIDAVERQYAEGDLSFVQSLIEACSGLNSD